MNSWSIIADETEIRAQALDDQRWMLTAHSLRGRPLPRSSCETTFPRPLVELLLKSTGPVWLCDTIARHEDPEYIRKILHQQLFAYFPAGAFVGKRLLDFGCGSGASTMLLGEMLPDTEIVGVELDKNHILEAKAIQQYRRRSNVAFMQSPSADSLPADVGSFDFIVLSAVFEHLLPLERTTLMPVVWSHLKIGGAIFISQTPHRWHPYEHHTTGLWGINYLPDRPAYWISRRLGGAKGQSWEEMLRGGIRGATERSIRVALTGGQPANAEILRPTQHGLRDRAGYWLSCASPRFLVLKRIIAQLFWISDRWLGTIGTLNVDVVMRRIR